MARLHDACGLQRSTRYLLALAAAVCFGIVVPNAGATVTGTNDAATVANAITDGSPGLQNGATFTIAGPVAECANGVDDDGNGLVDTADPGCTNASDDSEQPGFGGSPPQCQNLGDDDGDGKVDFAYPNPPGPDPQCASAIDASEAVAGVQAPECSTAADDDGDGDGGTSGTDPQCSAPGDNDESFVEECGDGSDDDGDGLTDMADPGCSFPYDDDESSNNPIGASTAKPAGVSNGPLAGFPTAGSTFAVLTSGNAELADDPNNSAGSGTANGGVAYGQANDPVTLKIDFNVPTGNNCVGFDFRFLSEEFPEFINQGFNDAFIAQLDNLSLNVNGSAINAPGDFAAGTGDLISVDSSGPSGMSDLFAAGTTYDGATPKLVARHLVDPGQHSLFLTIFDAGDHILDSAAFIDNLRVTNEPQGECHSLAVEPFEGHSGVSCGGDQDQPLDLSNDLAQLLFALHCNLPSGNELNCTVNFSFNFTASTGSGKQKRPARAAAAVPLATGSASVPAGQTQQVALPVTPAGKAAVTAAAKKPAKLRQQAKKLLKKAKHASPAKAKKLRAKAKKLLKQAKALEKQPLGTVTGTISNPVNGATDTVTLALPR